MGLGIAYVAANVTRLPVVLMDVSQAQTDKGMKFMGNILAIILLQSWI
jgi:3-hydroxybutyryl-CoA dehydrogenase